MSQLVAIPLFSVPHTSHFSIAFSSPEDPSRRFPQSVQNTRDPMAAMSLNRDLWDPHPDNCLESALAQSNLVISLNFLFWTAGS